MNTAAQPQGKNNFLFIERDDAFKMSEAQEDLLFLSCDFAFQLQITRYCEGIRRHFQHVFRGGMSKE